MATRISFSTVYPDRMGELAGKPTRFPEKLITMIDSFAENEVMNDSIFQLAKSGVYDFNFKVNYHPKTTTIRKNYDYWKSKEGKLLQPYFWAGKPRKSKQVVFCPEVRLNKVSRIKIMPDPNRCGGREVFICVEKNTIDHPCDIVLPESVSDIELFIQNEGFDHPDHFWMWFYKDYDGCLLEFEKGE